jgi:hypothetical protein
MNPLQLAIMGNKCKPTITDALKKYAEIFAIPSKETKTVIEVIFTQ